MRFRGLGPLLVATAALLWATDALFRAPTLGALSPAFIVLAEHAMAFAVILPWMLITHGRKILALRPSEWAAALLVGAGASAVATLFFTASFQFINPSVVILLQKLQPIMVVALAFLFLGERPGRGFFIWAWVALFAALVLSFPDLDFGFLKEDLSLRSRGVSFALSAAMIWALATVAGKAALKRTPPAVLTFWRYAFGLAASFLLVWLSEFPRDWQLIRANAQSLIYMGLVPGLIAMIAYYHGLRRTPASITTFVELLFPVAAVALNAIFLHATLQWVEILAGAALLFSVTKIAYRPT